MHTHLHRESENVSNQDPIYLHEQSLFHCDLFNESTNIKEKSIHASHDGKQYFKCINTNAISSLLLLWPNLTVQHHTSLVVEMVQNAFFITCCTSPEACLQATWWQQAVVQLTHIAEGEEEDSPAEELEVSTCSHRSLGGECTCCLMGMLRLVLLVVLVMLSPCLPMPASALTPFKWWPAAGPFLVIMPS